MDGNYYVRGDSKMDATVGVSVVDETSKDDKGNYGTSKGAVPETQTTRERDLVRGGRKRTTEG